jgi:hypothetical protein
MLDPGLIQKIARQIYRQFPAVAGNPPAIKTRSTVKTSKVITGAPPATSYLLTFHGAARAANGKEIPLRVRVAVSAQGKIIKISTSR